jgi:23S rRNA pseudouridine2604 synthase
MTEENYPMRINKYLAHKAICSRREADRLIGDGKVSINGKKAKLGDMVNEGDKVDVIGDQRRKNELVYLAYYKPRGIITHSPQGDEKSIADIFQFHTRVFPVGRLDKDSEGLIILTNDGRVTGRLLEPDRFHDKEYVVAVDKEVEQKFIDKMTKGVLLDDGYKTRECEARKIRTNAFSIILNEGKKRQIRRMCNALGQAVTSLKRVRVLNIKLAGMKPGQHRTLKGRELVEFMSKLGLEKS